MQHAERRLRATAHPQFLRGLSCERPRALAWVFRNSVDRGGRLQGNTVKPAPPLRVDCESAPWTIAWGDIIVSGFAQPAYITFTSSPLACLLRNLGTRSLLVSSGHETRSLYQSGQGGSGVACVEANIFLVEDLMGSKFVSNIGQCRILPISRVSLAVDSKLMVRPCAGTRGCCSSEPCSWQSCAWCCCRRGPRAEKNPAGETCKKLQALARQTRLNSPCFCPLYSSRDLQAEVELVLPDTSPLSGLYQLQLTSALTSSVCH